MEHPSVYGWIIEGNDCFTSLPSIHFLFLYEAKMATSLQNAFIFSKEQINIILSLAREISEIKKKKKGRQKAGISHRKNKKYFYFWRFEENNATSELSIHEEELYINLHNHQHDSEIRII